MRELPRRPSTSSMPGRCPIEVRKRVVDWYETDYMPRVRRLLGDKTPIDDFLPVGSAPYFLQDQYIVDNPYPKDRRKLVDDAGDGSTYNKLHATYHPLMRTAASTAELRRLHAGRPSQSSRIIYSVEKEAEFGTSLRAGPYRTSNLAAAAARCGQAPDPLGDLPRGLRRLPAVQRRAAGLHGGAGDRPGRRDRRAGGPALDRRDRQRSSPATGAGATRASAPPARPIWSVPTTCSAPARACSSRIATSISSELKGGQTHEHDIEDIRRYGTPVLQQRVDTTASRAALGGVEGTGEILGYRGIPDARLVGAAAGVRRQMGADRQDRLLGGLRADQAAASATSSSSAAWRCWW